MFLFLLIVSMVGWALGLVAWTQIALPACDESDQAENRGPLAVGSHSIWIDFQSRVLDLARVVGGSSAMPDNQQQLGGSGEQPWRSRRQEWNAGVLRQSALTSWSRELGKAVAKATPTQFDEHLTTGFPAHQRCKPCGEVGRSLLSLAQ